MHHKSSSDSVHHVFDNGGVVVIERPKWLNVAVISLIFTILTQIVLGVWAAGKFYQGMVDLQELTAEMRTALHEITKNDADQNIRLRILEDRQDRPTPRGF